MNIVVVDVTPGEGRLDGWLRRAIVGEERRDSAHQRDHWTLSMKPPHSHDSSRAGSLYQ